MAVHTEESRKVWLRKKQKGAIRVNISDFSVAKFKRKERKYKMDNAYRNHDKIFKNNLKLQEKATKFLVRKKSDVSNSTKLSESPIAESLPQFRHMLSKIYKDSSSGNEKEG